MEYYDFISTPLYEEFISNLTMEVKTPPSSNYQNDRALITGIGYYKRLRAAGYKQRYAANLAYWRGILSVEETPAGENKEELEEILQLKLEGGRL